MASRRARARARRRKKKIARIERRGRGRVSGGGGRFPISKGQFSGVKGIAAAAFLRSPLGKKALSVAIGRGRAAIRRASGGRLFANRRPPIDLVSTTGRAIATRPTKSLARRGATTAVKIAAGGVAFEAGSTIFSSFAGGENVVRKLQSGGGRSRPRGGSIAFTPGQVVPKDSIVSTWVANGVPFANLADGRVMVRRKNGTIKTFRRPRPIVLGRNPGVRDIVRADKKIDQLLKVVRKRFPPSRRAAPRSAPAAITQVRSG